MTTQKIEWAGTDAEPPERWIREPELVERTGLDRTTLWRQVQCGDFPPSYQIGPRSVAVRSDDFDLWMRTRPRSSIPSPKKPKRASEAAAIEQVA